jgi:type I restriction enzyme S subunit
MNADRLLALFERVADTPDAVDRIRRFILDLAVRGKLVPQDPTDEPASELLKRVADEKARLIGVGTIKRVRPRTDTENAAGPFELPRGWQWVQLGDIVTKLTDGTHHSPPNEPSGDFRYITAKNIKEEGISLTDVTFVSREIHEEIYSRCNPEKGDILYIKDGATTGVVTINNLDEPFSMLSSVALLKFPSCVFNRLVVAFLRSPFFYDQMRGFMKGAAITRVTLKRMAPALIALPPLSEQYRLVDKIDELMALCDLLEAGRAEREAKRDRLAKASFGRLNTPNPDQTQFASDARFALNILPALTARLDRIRHLRQTILNLAVRGKLVPQDPADEPASRTLTALAHERAELSAKRIIRSIKSLEAGAVADPPFKIPDNWAWSRIGAAVLFTEYGTSQKSQHSDAGIPVLTMGTSRTARLSGTGTKRGFPKQAMHFQDCFYASSTSCTTGRTAQNSSARQASTWARVTS